jgi:hypothetical protein
MNLVERLVEECSERRWPQLARFITFEPRGHEEELQAIAQGDTSERTRIIAKVALNGFQSNIVRCPHCCVEVQCLLVESVNYTLPRRSRLCLSCGETFATSEMSETALFDLTLCREIMEELCRVPASEYVVGDLAFREARLKFEDILRREEARRAESPSVEFLEIPNRAINALLNEQVQTLDQLCELSANNLLEMRHMTERLVDDIRAALAKRGRRLACE